MLSNLLKFRFTMMLRSIFGVSCKQLKSQMQMQYYCTNQNNIYNFMCKYLGISVSKAEYLYMKYPAVRTLNDVKLKELTDTVYNLGYPAKVLVDEPVLFCYLPITLQYRHQVLLESGFKDITSEHWATYLPLVKNYTVQTLKSKGIIPVHVNVENRLASYMTQWPTSLTTTINNDINEYSLYQLRLKILQRYLELMLDLTSEEFLRGIKTYPTIKHRPLAVINETLSILLSEIMMPVQKIKSNFYLLHADPHNLKQILYIKIIGGIDIKEVLKMHPRIALKNYSTLIEIKNILKEYEIQEEAQRRCFDIYTLSPNTIRERLEVAKTIPEFQTFAKHPRYLKMIHYKTTAMKRLFSLYNNNKKCLSLNILSGSSAHYDVFERSPGDRLGKGKDLIFCIAQCFDNKYSSAKIRQSMKRHPFWINIPLVQVKYVFQKLSSDFSLIDIYDNCPILLYQWEKIKNMLKLLKQGTTKYNHLNIDISQLTKSQILSLVLYLLEQNHYFSGNGVWSEDKLNYVNNTNTMKNILVI